MLTPEQADRLEMLCWADHVATLAAGHDRSADPGVSERLAQAIVSRLSIEERNWRAAAQSLLCEDVQVERRPQRSELATELVKRLASAGMAPEAISALAPDVPGKAAG